MEPITEKMTQKSSSAFVVKLAVLVSQAPLSVPHIDKKTACESLDHKAPFLRSFHPAIRHSFRY
jgi:hypothetical protein